MIALAPARNRLSPLEQFGLLVLVDQSALLPVEAISDQVVSLELDERVAEVGQVPQFSVESGHVSVPRALLARIASVAGAVAEQESRAEDRHQRVPSAVNAMVAAGQPQTPWVNGVARAFREAVVSQAQHRPVRTIAPWPGGHRWAAAFTHDLDVVSWWPLFTGLRLLELAKKGRAGQAARVGGAAARSALGDPVTAGVRELLGIEREYAIPATWFVIAGEPTLRTILQGDVTYAVESRRARGVLSAILADGHEIGLHGSFATFQDTAVMAEERDRLRRATGAAVHGVRQHFLRMRPGATQRAMMAAGFEYDSTFGFPDRNGFRLGLANVVPSWDQTSGRIMPLEQAPLVWMDRALSKYRGIEAAARWVDEGLELARIAQAEEGLWVGLWHPNLTTPLGFPGAPAEFRRLVEIILARQPYVASLGAMVEWRRARRSLTARAVSDQGIPALSAGVPGNWPVVLEDGKGKAVEHLSWPAAA